MEQNNRIIEIEHLYNEQLKQQRSQKLKESIKVYAKNSKIQTKRISTENIFETNMVEQNDQMN